MGRPDNGIAVMADESTDNFLAHYGIKGMKWGVRRKRADVEVSSDHAKTREIEKKQMSEMTNAELKALTTRLNLEKQYRELNTSAKPEGKKFAQELLIKGGKQIAQQQFQKYLNKGIDIAIEAAMAYVKAK